MLHRPLLHLGLVVLGALACLPACHRSPDDQALAAAIMARHPLGPGVQKDWVEQDVRLLISLRHDIEPFVTAATRHERVDCGPRDGGLCARIRARDDLYGGYTTCHESIFAHDGAVAGMHLDCHLSPDQRAAVTPFLLDALGDAGRMIPAGVGYRFQDDALVAKARSDGSVALGLGPFVPLVPPPELAEAFDELTSPFSVLDLGDACGDVGVPGRGHDKVDAIVRAGRLDLVRSVAHDLNAEGRVFAARALLAHARPLSPDDVTLIQKVRAAPGMVRRCEGCSPGWKKAAELLPDPAAP